MNPLLFGALISWGVSFLKRLPVVKNNPKVSAVILSAVATAGTAVFSNAGGQPMDLNAILSLASQTATTFGVAVATHEAVTEPIAAAVLSVQNSSTSPK